MSEVTKRKPNKPAKPHKSQESSQWDSIDEKQEKHMFILGDAESACDKIKHLFWIKTLRKLKL